MNFQQDSAISSIQERIQRLETIVSGGSHGYYDEEIGNTSLMDELKEAQNKLNLLKREDATIESFFDLYHQVESLLFTNSKHSDGSVEPSLYEVDLDAKHEIVVSATQDLTNISKCLKQIDELKHELDSNLLNDQKSLQLSLGKLELEGSDDMRLIKSMNHQFITLVAEHNQFIQSVSELFIKYHHLLNEIEKEN